jgi:hypothetical protein
VMVKSGLQNSKSHAISDDVHVEQKHSCDTVMQILLILPSILRQVGLSPQEFMDATQVVKELTEFVSENYKDLLESNFHPPEEEYAAASDEITVEPISASQFPNPDPVGNDALSGETTEVIFDHEKLCLTDYMVSVMEQVITCRATEDDVRRKSRKINEGFPGIVCRHCLGTSGGGRYFFSAVETITTSYTVIENHLMKCTECPSDVKSKIIETKPYHSEQRKNYKSGSQAAFFARLWDRLSNSNTIVVKHQNFDVKACAEKTLNNPLTQEEEHHLTDGISEMIDSANKMTEYGSHIEVLDFVRGVAIGRRDNSDLQDSLNLYYSCLDYGGRVSYTPSMPTKFSSEWLLSKLLPGRNKLRDDKVENKYKGYG